MKKFILLQVLFSILLCYTAYAKTYDITQISQAKLVTEYSEDTTVDQMDTVRFGSYYYDKNSNRKPLYWTIYTMSKEFDYAALICKDIIDYMPFHNSLDDSITWESCSLRAFLNNDFLNNAFNDVEKKYLIKAKVVSYDESYESPFFYDTTDVVYLPDYYECTHININGEKSIFIEELSKAKPTEYAKYKGLVDSTYLTRERRNGNFEKCGVLAVIGDFLGARVGCEMNEPVGIRPMVWISLSGTRSESQNDDQQTYDSNVEVSINETFSKHPPNFLDIEIPNRDDGVEMPEYIREILMSKITTKAQVKNGWLGDYYYENDVLVKNRWIGEYYVGADGKYLKNQWIDNTYYVGADGKILKNTTTPDGYKVDADGKRITGSNTSANNNTQANTNSTSTQYGGTIAGLPSRESELKNDNRFYLDDNVQKNSWVYYVKEYYHVDGSGNIEKSKWIEQRYVGSDGKMYRGRQTPDGQWVGNDGLVVNVTQDLQKSILVEAAEPDSWYRTQNGLWYYFENDRTTTKRGWFNDKRDDQWYYLEPSTGIMQVGWVNIDGKDYYFNESHDNEPNWYEIEDGFYESYGKKVKSYGSMFKNEKTPDGYWVNNDGVFIQNSDAVQEKDNTKTLNNSKNKSKYNDVLKAVPIIIIVTLLIGAAVYVNKKF